VFDDDLFQPQRSVQRVGDFWGLREEFRKQALASLRRREGLPTSERLVGAFYQRADGFYREPPGKEVSLDTTMYSNGNGGFSNWAMGTRKGLSREEAEDNWGRINQFEVLEVAEDGRRIESELFDLVRDVEAFEKAEKVSHGAQSEQAPDLALSNLSDEEVNRKLQEYLKKEKQ
jgi:hypothetical protein